MLSGTQHRPFRLKTFQILALQQFRGSCVFHIFSFPGVFSRSNGVKIGVKPIALSFYTKNLETVGAVKLRDFERPIGRPHSHNLLISECLCVSFHCSADIPMFHNVLKHLNVNITLTHPCAESMPQYMDVDFWKSPLLTSCCYCFFILNSAYSYNSSGFIKYRVTE